MVFDCVLFVNYELCDRRFMEWSQTYDIDCWQTDSLKFIEYFRSRHLNAFTYHISNEISNKVMLLNGIIQWTNDIRYIWRSFELKLMQLDRSMHMNHSGYLIFTKCKNVSLHLRNIAFTKHGRAHYILWRHNSFHQKIYETSFKFRAHTFHRHIVDCMHS